MRWIVSNQNQSSMDAAKPLRSILLIEDSLADVFIIQQIFERKKVPITLEVARDGEEGMSVLRQQDRRAALSGVLLDLGLPKVSGIEILASAQREAWNLPIIVITCEDWPGGLERIIELGAAAYFRKPFALAEYSELPNVLFAALNQHKSSEKTRREVSAPSETLGDRHSEPRSCV